MSLSKLNEKLLREIRSHGYDFGSKSATLTGCLLLTRQLLESHHWELPPEINLEYSQEAGGTTRVYKQGSCVEVIELSPVVEPVRKKSTKKPAPVEPVYEEIVTITSIPSTQEEEFVQW